METLFYEKTILDQYVAWWESVVHILCNWHLDIGTIALVKCCKFIYLLMHFAKVV